jgi:hypothetical protein
MMTRLFGWILRDRDREMILGDLAEERALLASSLSPSQAARWYRRQVIRSVAPVMWANICRGVWLKTVGAILASYALAAVLVGAGFLIPLPHVWLSLEFTSLLCGFVAGVAGGYVAAWMRPRAYIGLAVFFAFMAIVSLVTTGDAAPFWYQVSLIIIGPAAVTIGGRLRLRRKERS